MANNNTIVGLAIPYFILIVITWITAGSISPYPPHLPWLYQLPGGGLILFGCLFLIPVFILTIIFVATEDDACEKVAFGLSMAGFFLIIVGDLIAIYNTIDNYLSPTLLLIWVLPLIILSFGLFANRNNTSLPNQRIVSRRIQPLSTPTRPIQQGGVQIPEAVRLAGTYGQSIKLCVRCSNTLDARTRICFFCGMTQPAIQTDAPPLSSTPSPAPSPSIYPRVQPPAMVARPQRFCPNCGASTSPEHLFCTQCGSSLE